MEVGRLVPGCERAAQGVVLRGVGSKTYARDGHDLAKVDDGLVLLFKTRDSRKHHNPVVRVGQAGVLSWAKDFLLKTGQALAEVRAFYKEVAMQAVRDEAVGWAILGVPGRAQNQAGLLLRVRTISNSVRYLEHVGFA